MTGVKWLVERPRPITSVGSDLLPGDPSFPSGHTAAAVIVSVMMILTVRNFARKCFPDGEDDGRANGRRVFLRRAVIGAVALVGCLFAIAARLALSDRRDYFRHHLSAHFLRRMVCMERIRKRGGAVKTYLPCEFL